MTALCASEVKLDSFNGPGRHPGLWMDRFCPEASICDQKEQKPHLETICGLKPATADYKALLQRHLATSRLVAPIHPQMPLTLRWRLALHLSRASALENAAICLHPIYGFAYLPGSGLKGLARAYASLLWERDGGAEGKAVDGWSADEFRQRFEQVFGWAPNDERRGMVVKTAGELEALRDPSFGQHQDENPACRGAVIFHDAWADAYPTLEVDTATCHYPSYYQDVHEPGDWMEPNPISFLSVAPGLRFWFCLGGRDQTLVDQALEWLFGGLYWLGAGAKTAAGYGAFHDSSADHKKMDEQAERERQKIQQQDTERRMVESALRLQDLAGRLAKDEVLVVAQIPPTGDPNLKTSRTGRVLAWAGQTGGSDLAFFYKKVPLPVGKVLKARTEGRKDEKQRLIIQGPIEDLDLPPPL